MKIIKDGVIHEMTPELEAEWRKEMSDTPAPEPTPEERIAELEQELAAAKILLGLED